jgi:hypothetical protein
LIGQQSFAMQWRGSANTSWQPGCTVAKGQHRSHAPIITTGSEPRLTTARRWVERHARTIIVVVILGLAASRLRDGVAVLLNA